MTSLRAVDPAGWREAVAAALAEGFTLFDWLGGLDDVGRADTLTVTLSLCDLTGPRWVWLRTSVPRTGGELDSVCDLVPGAGWHEREAAELLGVRFAGGDPRRLLLGASFEGTPLRKDEVLGARAAQAWPGAKEPGESVASASPSRRRMVPPGVPEPGVWGSRDPADGPADPAEVAASAQGGRVRRRR